MVFHFGKIRKELGIDLRVVVFGRNFPTNITPNP
jgi:hypothetical protein